jgi:hypothetical protein
MAPHSGLPLGGSSTALNGMADGIFSRYAPAPAPSVPLSKLRFDPTFAGVGVWNNLAGNRVLYRQALPILITLRLPHLVKAPAPQSGAFAFSLSETRPCRCRSLGSNPAKDVPSD